MQRVLTVMTASTTQDLTILSTVKTHLRITGSSHDTQLTQMIKRASDAIANACDRVFAEEVVKETIFLERSQSPIVLRRYPVTAISSVVEAGVTLDASNYLVDQASGRIFRIQGNEVIEWPARKIEITYTGGYELLADLPYDLEEACLTLVAHSWASAGRDPMAKRIEIPDVQTTDYWVGGIGEPGRLPPDVEAKIAPYRNWRI